MHATLYHPAVRQWAAKEGVTDAVLRVAVAEMAQGLVEADLGGHVYKKRVGLPGRGKRGGARTLLAFRIGDRAVFLYGYAKNERDNIDAQELKALKRLAAEVLGWTEAQLDVALAQGKLIEVVNHG
ncbi:MULTISPECIES: type II toxin-antitoxin system RelE/ParE family toxin [unclassified Cupriavidus]|uniref:type II toxin-antitoxin system RelE/ParE family toxin n=1 Tax=unclassified Cupriavidus TaxID=2640874 RepID=UPI003F91283F